MAFRDSPFQALKAPLTWTAALVALVVGLIAFALFFTDHRSPASAGAYGPVRGEFDELMEPVTSVLSAPVRWISSAGDWTTSYFFAVSENRQLKKQLAEMQRWRDAAIALKNLDVRYEALLKLRTEPPIPMVTARAVSDARGPFSDARLLDAGSNAGIKVGNPAMSENGVVGRVVGVAKNASRILLLSDVQSRTPVLINRSNARAILTGDGGPNPKLEFVRGVNSVVDGDMVLTSGDGGLYPRGLPVGVAAKDFRGVWRVRLYADREAIDFVRILIFDDFSQSVNQAELASSILPPLTGQEQAQLQAARAAAVKPPPAPAAGSPAALAAATAAAAASASKAPAIPAADSQGAQTKAAATSDSDESPATAAPSAAAAAASSAETDDAATPALKPKPKAKPLQAVKAAASGDEAATEAPAAKPKPKPATAAKTADADDAAKSKAPVKAKPKVSKGAYQPDAGDAAPTPTRKGAPEP